jgi:3(or 17)beta-hydroxysteroid dehydrogenase
MERVKDKVAIVTGGGSGLGRADAERLSQEGARVVVTDIDRAAAERAAAEIPNAIGICHDVRDEAGWIDVIAQTERSFGRLDILVNNAGLVRFGSLLESTLADWTLQMDVMATGTFLGCRYAIPLMAKSGGGSIINMSSVAAMKGIGTIPGYSAAKGAIIAFSRSTAVFCQEQGNGIRVNAIVPGAHDTPMTRQAIAQLDPGEAGMQQIVAVGQGRPEDVANLVLFLASDEARQITGTAITIDNGETMK